MAMNPTILIEAIKARLTSELGYDFSDAASPSSMEIVLEEIINHIITYGEINTTLIQSLQSIFINGAPVPTDGGASLKLAWINLTAAGAKDKSTGTIK